MKKTNQKNANNNKRNRQVKATEPQKSPSTKGVTQYPVTEPSELLPFLLQILSKQSRNSVKSILTRGQVTVDGKVLTKHNHPLEPGQTVGILANKEALKKTSLSGLKILFEDEAIIVINKDASLLSMATDDPKEPTAYRQLSQYVKEDNKANRIFVVHRLDRDTSGVMLFAKSEELKEKLQNNWKEIVKERIYTALVEGEIKKDAGTISSWLTESKAMKVHSSPKDNGGQHAVTHYRKIRANKEYSLLEVELETGRKNQIRVHMESLGHPVAGDKKYGARTNPMKRLGLHATTLAFIHPATGELVRFSAPVPKAFLLYSK